MMDRADLRLATEDIARLLKVANRADRLLCEYRIALGQIAEAAITARSIRDLVHLNGGGTTEARNLLGIIDGVIEFLERKR